MKDKQQLITESLQRSEERLIDAQKSGEQLMREAGNLKSVLQKNVELLVAASKVCGELFYTSPDQRIAVLVTDSMGRILEMYFRKEVWAPHENGLQAGVVLKESHVGTNAVALAIEYEQGFYLTGKQNYLNLFQEINMAAVPVINHNNVLGAIAVVGLDHYDSGLYQSLAALMGKSIERVMASRDVKQQLEDSQQYAFAMMNSLSFGMIAVNTSGKIEWINDRACNILNIKRTLLLEKSVKKYLPDYSRLKRSTTDGRIVLDEEVSFKMGKDSEHFSVNVYPIESPEGEDLGVIISFREMQRVFNLVNKYTGMQAHFTFADVLCVSEKMKRLKRYAERVADSPTTVLIQGPSGTGKEVIAQSIHNASERRERGFVAINCGAIPPHLIESELFGYDSGAFTGAKKGGNPGKFELANGGTLFLDEIGEMPLDMQVKLLRALQENAVTRVGGDKYIPVDVRIIAATNKNLEQEVDQGNFRLDLFYRLSVIPVTIPALKDRIEDLPLLLNHFLRSKSNKLRKPLPKVTESHWQRLKDYHWPGNIRELENYAEKMVNLGGQVAFDDGLKTVKDHAAEIRSESVRELKSIAAMEKDAIEEALLQLSGNVSMVARVLGISRNTLYLKMKKYKISN